MGLVLKSIPLKDSLTRLITGPYFKTLCVCFPWSRQQI